MTTTRRTNTTESVYAVVDFAAKDSKGRTVGCRVETYETDFIETLTGEYGCLMPVGHYFVACVEATRDGIRYGAGQPSKHFATAAERTAFIAKRVETSRKAAAKKA